MRTRSQKDKVENHENKKVYFDLNEKLKACNLEHFKLLLKKFSKWDKKKLLNNVGAVYGSPLHRMIQSNKFEFVKYMVESCGLDVNSEDEGSIPPLWCAYDKGYIRIVKYLLSKGANAKQVGPHDKYLLFEACKKRQMSLVKYLLEKKLVDVNQEDENNYNCAYQLFLPKKQIRSIIRGPRKVPPPSKFLRLLLKHGLDAGHINFRCEPLLQYVIDRRNLPSLRLLERNGAFTGITEECNKLSPIIYAAMMDTGEKVVEYLLRSDCVYLSDKIFGANLLAAQLRGEKQLEYFVKAVEMRNEGWKDFNYAAYIEKHGTERQPRVIGRSSPPGYRDMSVDDTDKSENTESENEKDTLSDKSGMETSSLNGIGDGNNDDSDVGVQKKVHDVGDEKNGDDDKKKTNHEDEEDHNIEDDDDYDVDGKMKEDDDNDDVVDDKKDDDDNEDDDDYDDEDDDDEPIFVDVMAETVDEMRKIGHNQVQLQVYVVKILRHIWDNVFKINLGWHFSEIEEDLFLEVELERRPDMLLPLLMAYVTRYEHQKTSYTFNTSLDDLAMLIRTTKFSDESYKWILKLLELIGEHISLLAMPNFHFFTIPDRANRQDTPAVLKLRFVQLLDAVLIHKGDACEEMTKVLREVLKDEKKEGKYVGKSVGFLHAAVLALPMCKSDIVKLLLRLGASANQLDEFDTSPLYHLAAFCGLPQMERVGREKVLEVFNLLLQYGAHLDYCDTEGESAVNKFQKNMFDISTVKHQSLQCLAAREVHRIPGFHEAEIPEHLRDFVTKHNPTFRKTVKIPSLINSFGDITDLMYYENDYDEVEDDDEDADYQGVDVIMPLI